MGKMTVGSVVQLTTTPGPWEYVPKLTASENHNGFFVRAERATKTGKWALAEVQPGDEDGKLGEANARLIAAAPMLLAALQKARAELAGLPHSLGYEFTHLPEIDSALASAGIGAA